MIAAITYAVASLVSLGLLWRYRDELRWIRGIIDAIRDRPKDKEQPRKRWLPWRKRRD